MRVLLISTYELGRQPFGLASAAAWLRRAGFDVVSADLSRQRLDQVQVRTSGVIAFSLPMHTATRLALPVIEAVHTLNPVAHLCAFGIYGPQNADLLRARGIETVLDGEFEADLATIAEQVARGERTTVGAARQIDPRARSISPATPLDRRQRDDPDARSPADARVPRLAFVTPDRSGLPPLQRYAALQVSPGESRVAGYTEASRGCKHLCRHCPVVPIYGGSFRIVPVDVVLADIRNQVDAGARHISFGDPDFFNGIGHALRVLDALPRHFPGLTYDIVVKIEHLLKHAQHLPTLRDTGCLFVTSAVESVDDRTLEMLGKGHTVQDFERAVALCRDARLPLAPTFVPFTPWTTLGGYCELLDTIRALDLIGAVAPIQLAIRLLVPAGSLMLGLPDVRGRLGPFDPELLFHPWTHVDGRVDDLQRAIQRVVAGEPQTFRRATFEAISRLARQRAGLDEAAAMQHEPPLLSRAAVPFLTEPWYC
jgi:radical SAM superfamily enzyme YgiQ (UPF0313 family)